MEITAPSLQASRDRAGSLQTLAREFCLTFYKIGAQDLFSTKGSLTNAEDVGNIRLTGHF